MPNPLTTTDATTTVLLTFEPPAHANSFAVWEFNLAASNDVGTQFAEWLIRVAAKSVSGSTSLVGTATTLSHHADAAASSWAVTFDINVTAVRLLVTGVGATVITWALQGERQKLTGDGSLPRWSEVLP